MVVHIRKLNEIANPGLNVLTKRGYILDNQNDNPHGIILRSHPLQEEDIPSSVIAIARAGAGVNNIPVETCTRRGIVVFNTPGANANSVTELVICSMLLSARKILEGVNWVKQQKINASLQETIEKGKNDFAGSELRGKTLGVLGLGAIGVRVCRAAVDLGMKVLGYDPFISIASAWDLSSQVVRCDSMENLLNRSDYISLHIPKTEKTTGLLSSEKIQRVKPGIRILNFSREGLVDRKAIIQALSTGLVSLYVTDFPTPDIVETDGVICIPHLGASTVEAEENCAVMAAAQLTDFLESGNIVNSVNFPTCVVPPCSGSSSRILVINKNIPNMLHQIINVLSDDSVNIEEMSNRHKGRIAYNIIDLATPYVDDSIIPKLMEIDGVIAARKICS